MKKYYYRLFNVIDILGDQRYFVSDVLSPELFFRVKREGSYRELCRLGREVTLAQYAELEQTACIWSITIDYITDTITIATYRGLPYRPTHLPQVVTLYCSPHQLMDQ